MRLHKVSEVYIALARDAKTIPIYKTLYNPDRRTSCQIQQCHSAAAFLCSLCVLLGMAWCLLSLFGLGQNHNKKQHKLNADLRTILPVCSFMLCHTRPLTSDFSDLLRYLYSVMCS